MKNKKLAQQIHETQKQAVAPAPLEVQIANLAEIIGALVDVVGAQTVVARLDARRAERAQPKPKKP